MQRSGKRFRVNVQLIDAETANHIWAERFDKPVADLFDTQDEIVSLLANALNAQLIEAEAQRAQHLVHPDAIDLTFQGFSWSYKGPTFEYVAQARIFFERALEIDPRSYRALVGMARVHLAMGAGMLAPLSGLRSSWRPRRMRSRQFRSPRTTRGLTWRWEVP
jgi:hypothetical protein